MTIDELKDQLRDLRAEYTQAIGALADRINDIQEDLRLLSQTSDLLIKHAHQHETPPTPPEGA